MGQVFFPCRLFEYNRKEKNVGIHGQAVTNSKLSATCLCQQVTISFKKKRLNNISKFNFFLLTFTYYWALKKTRHANPSDPLLLLISNLIWCQQKRLFQWKILLSSGARRQFIGDSFGLSDDDVWIHCLFQNQFPFFFSWSTSWVTTLSSNSKK